jgi:UDP-N-acetylmuramoyl-tripeptide--D-alanyl-D-alanine ligase
MQAVFKRFVTAVLTREAQWLLRRMSPTVVAVTGSVGKTSTKDAIYAAVRQHRTARKSEQSFNSELGVPLAVLGMRGATHWAGPRI